MNQYFLLVLSERTSLPFPEFSHNPNFIFLYFFLNRLPSVSQVTHHSAWELPPHHGWTSAGWDYFWSGWEIPPGHEDGCVFPVPPPPHRAGCGLFHAHPPVLREHRHHLLVRRGRDALEFHWHRGVPVWHLPDRSLRPEWHHFAAESALWQLNLGRGPRGRARCLREYPSQRAALHPGLRGVPAEWCRDSGEWRFTRHHSTGPGPPPTSRRVETLSAEQAAERSPALRWEGPLPWFKALFSLS